MQIRKGSKKGAKYNEAHPHEFGKKLHALRKKKGMTQPELAAKMNTTVRAISYYEREVKNPTIELIDKLAEALNVPKKAFFDDSTNDNIEEQPAVIKSLKMILPKLSALSRKEQESLALMIRSMVNK